MIQHDLLTQVRVRFNSKIQFFLVGLLCTGLVLSPSITAFADTTPPSGTPATVSADVLPAPQIDGVVWHQVTVGNTVYATGKFSTARPAGVALGGAGTVTRNGLLAYDLVTGKLSTTFVHSLGGSSGTPCIGSSATGPQGCAISASPDGTMLYVGGTFTTVDGLAHANLVAINLSTNTVVSGFQGVNSKVRALVASNTGVYIGGTFSQAGGAAHSKLAYFNKSGTINNGWNATVNGSINGMTIAKNKLIVAGSFTSANNLKFWSNAAMSLATGASITPWASSSDSFPIRGVDPNGGYGSALMSASTDGNQVYITSFTNLSGTAAQRAYTFEGRMAISADNGALVWLNDCVGDSYDAFPIGQVLYSASHMHGCAPRDFMSDNTKNRTYFHGAAETTYKTGYNTTTNLSNYPSYVGQPGSTILNWFPKFTQGSATGIGQATWSVTGNVNYVSYGGEFIKVNGIAQQGLVRFAVKAYAPNKMKPFSYPSGLAAMAYPADSNGNAVVRFYVTGDPDNATLTYEIYRVKDNKLVGTRVIDSRFWKGTSSTVTDTGVIPGRNLDYYLKVKDPFGNTMQTGNTTAINDTDTRVVYSSGWTSIQNRDDLNPDFARGMHYTGTNGASVTFTFYGTNVSVISEKGADRGSANVSIDGGAAVSISAYSSQKMWQQNIFTKTGLTNGRHTIKITKTSGTYFDIDAFRVIQN